MSYHGRELGIPVVVVMPRHAPIMKVNNCKSFGAIVLVNGIDLAEVKAFEREREACARHIFVKVSSL